MSAIDEVIAKYKIELKEAEHNANLTMAGVECMAELHRVYKKLREAEEIKARHEQGGESETD